jgi:nicotinic acid mononucleotide adenylyltransferase
MNEQYLHLSPRTIRRLRRVQGLLDHLQSAAEPEALIIPSLPQPHGNIIVFPGSFNPPTIAHLAMLKEAQRFARSHQPMRVYVALSKHTVDKESVERPLLLDRIMLLRRLLRKRLPHAGILLFNRGLYVEQAQAIRRSFRRVKHILFLVGFDKIVQILDPCYYEDRDAALAELFRLAGLLVAPRGFAGMRELEALLQQPQNERFARYIRSLPFSSVYREVSSTKIRQGVSGSAREIPQEVRQFIQYTRAYASPLRREDGTEIDAYEERVKSLNALLRNKASDQE